MKMLFVTIAVLLVSSSVDAAPRKTSQTPDSKVKRQSFDFYNGASVYPNYFVQHAPVGDFKNSFLQSAFLPSASDAAGLNLFSAQLNRRDVADGKPLALDAATSAAFAASFGDKKTDKTAAAGLDASGNVNVVNPFLAAKDGDGKLLKAESGLPGVTTGKLGDLNSKAFSFVNPYHGHGLDPVFGPEIAPKYEIHYDAHGYNYDPAASHYLAPGLNSFPFGAGLHPTFNSAFGPYPSAQPIPYPSSFPSSPYPYPSEFPAPFPYPYPVVPGFDPKTLKPVGKDDGGKKVETSSEHPPETSSENFQETSSESSTPDLSSSQAPAESSSSDSSTESSSQASV